jgi:hypothetical protein
MYGVIGSAIFVGIISIQLIKKFNIKTIDGEKIVLHQNLSAKDRYTAVYYLALAGP